ncbi:MAG: hypothetical protein GY711_23675 [bacterium]|nr:hypothetical protein [bacterium]
MSRGGLRLADGPVPLPAARSFRCRRAAVWLARALAASVLVAAALAASRIDPAGVFAVSGSVRSMVLALGGLLGWVVLRQGAELRTVVTVKHDALEFDTGKKQVELSFDDVESIGFAHPMGEARIWLPALTLDARHERRWRISALISGGDELLRELLARSAREDLATWDKTLYLSRRMSRAGRWTAAGYVLAVLLPLAALGLRLV